MRTNAGLITVKDVRAEAKTWNLTITPRQAKSILSRNAAKIKHAMRNAAQEVVKAEVADYLFAQEERELDLIS